MTDSETKAGDETGFIAHLVELRSRLIYIVLGILLVLICLIPFADSLYSILAYPLLAHLPASSTMIAIDVAAPFLIPFKLVMLLAIVITVPYSLYHIWAFIAPGLYQREKILVVPLLASSTLLFYLGIAFAYFVVFPLVFGFIIGMAPEGIAVMTDIGRYLDFVVAMFLAFGIAFEIPIATVLLVATGITTPQALSDKRPYVIVGVFVIGMFLTPPDVISQILLAIPMWLLFEAGIFASRLVLKRQIEDEDAEVGLDH